jgi:hypothetical protein
MGPVDLDSAVVLVEVVRGTAVVPGRRSREAVPEGREVVLPLPAFSLPRVTGAIEGLGRPAKRPVLEILAAVVVPVGRLFVELVEFVEVAVVVVTGAVVVVVAVLLEVF